MMDGFGFAFSPLEFVFEHNFANFVCWSIFYDIFLFRNYSNVLHTWQLNMSVKKYQINFSYRSKVGNAYLERKYILNKYSLYNVSKKFDKLNRLKLVH